ncbi:very short patch repair endonuclease [Marinobacter oulmenensis]|uniref:very short patch repair endonuclease n=1 Tax=Marinobacter oulmenensis TaxID=643747 RepID=UPI0031B61326
MRVRKTLHSMGMQFRIHRRDLSGKPDIVLPRHGLIIFVHGCFWHRHSGCRLASVPKTRPEFWEAKFRSNRLRDKRNKLALEDMRWLVEVVWECVTMDQTRLDGVLVNNLNFDTDRG